MYATASINMGFVVPKSGFIQTDHVYELLAGDGMFCAII